MAPVLAVPKEKGQTGRRVHTWGCRRHATGSMLLPEGPGGIAFLGSSNMDESCSA